MDKKSIDQWLQNATEQLKKADIDSARLDAEIILCHTLRHPKTYLHAHGDELIEPRMLEIANARLDLRFNRVPVAYIIGHWEFYGRRFKVTTATLIPRPETETMIELLKAIVPANLPLLPQTLHVVDVGTGSGCLGITAKLELPELNITLLDISTHALKVAETNAKVFDVDVQCIKSDLLTSYPFQPDIILANLPYVDESWEVSPETTNEPREALFAAKNGLALIDKLIEQSSSRLPEKGFLLLEADKRQHAAIAKTAKSNDFTVVNIQGLIVCLQKTS